MVCDGGGVGLQPTRVSRSAEDQFLTTFNFSLLLPFVQHRILSIVRYGSL